MRVIGCRTMYTREQKIELQRRAWELRLRGATQHEIAAELQVSQPYVCALLKKAREELVEQNRLDAATATGEQVGRLDRMIAALTAQAEAGDVKAVQALLAVEDRRAKLLGLDAATRKAVDLTSGGAPLAYHVTIPVVQRIDADSDAPAAPVAASDSDDDGQAL